MKITNCGTAIKETTGPSRQAKIIAVKKSRMDFEIRMVCSPVMPETMEP